jgi:hypothetical protein
MTGFLAQPLLDQPEVVKDKSTDEEPREARRQLDSNPCNKDHAKNDLQDWKNDVDIIAQQERQGNFSENKKDRVCVCLRRELPQARNEEYKAQNHSSQDSSTSFQIGKAPPARLMNDHAASSGKYNPKDFQNTNAPMFKTKTRPGPWFWSFEFGSLNIVWDFVLRISDFQLLRKSERSLCLGL